MNIVRRLPLYRLLLLCGLVIAIGVSATALAFALGSGTKPPAKPLAQAVHDALGGAAGTPIEGVSANITLTNRLIEGANLADSGGGSSQLASSPLLSGGSGRLWIAKDGRVRLELQAEKGDTQILYDGHTISLYDASSNTLYRYTPSAGEKLDTSPMPPHGEAPSLAKIEEAIAHLKAHADLSEATPSDVGGQPAYTVRISPKESGSLIGGAELSFDAVHGVPLRAAIYSSTSSSPVIELAATEVSYGAVESSVFEFKPPASAKIEEIKSSSASSSGAPDRKDEANKPTVTPHGKGITAIAVGEGKVPAGGEKSTSSALENLPKVNINGASASELRTELGTILSFERSGVRYVLAGAVSPAAVEALARGL